jgi:hypothetical protein
MLLNQQQLAALDTSTFAIFSHKPGTPKSGSRQQHFLKHKQQFPRYPSRVHHSLLMVDLFNITGEHHLNIEAPTSPQMVSLPNHSQIRHNLNSTLLQINLAANLFFVLHVRYVGKLVIKPLIVTTAWIMHTKVDILPHN